MLILDVECFRNYFLVLTKDTETSKVFEIETIDDFKKLAKDNIFITFNGLRFDELLIRYWLNGADEYALKEACDSIIRDNIRQSEFYRTYKCDQVTKINMIDIMEVCPGKGGLKLYGARWHCKTIAELPFSPYQDLTEEEKRQVKKYCENDLNVTELLYNKLEKQINLRRNMSNQLKMDLRSKSDAQIAEAIISKRIGNIPKATGLQKEFTYKMPDFIQFENDSLNTIKHQISECLSL